MPGWLDPTNIITSMGNWAVIGVMAIVFAECGILLGFFLPGDTLLFISGLMVAGGSALQVSASATPLTNLSLLIGLIIAAAFVGNIVGYWIGYKVGPAVFKRPDAKFLKPEYIEKSAHFYEKYGKITVVLARFVPVVRTVATVMAGASKMNARIYTFYSFLGGVLWVATVTTAGYFLGQITFIRDNLDIIVILAVFAVVLGTSLPALAHWWMKRRTRRLATAESE